MEFESVEHFQGYFFNVYSSSYPTTAEQIIFFSGLYILFLECAPVAENQAMRAECKIQGEVCRKNMETLLAGLPFHMPCTYDYVLALALAVSEHDCPECILSEDTQTVHLLTTFLSNILGRVLR